MPTYIGYSSLQANQPRSTNSNGPARNGSNGITNPVSYGDKFKSVDEQLVIRDFLNAINIPLGQKVGQPQYGTTLWSFIFEPNTADTQFQLEDELKRIVGLDPRLQLGSIQVYPQENGILLQLQVAVNPFNNPAVISVFFNPANNTAVLQ